MTNRNKLLTVILLFSVTSTVFGFDFSAYKSTTLSQMLKEQSTDDCRPTKPNESIYSGQPHKYRFKTKFTKELREIQPGTKLYLERYAKSMPWSKEFISLYEHEFLVKGDNKNYWVPVQQNLLPHMGSELTIGQQFELYVAVLGKNQNKCIFLATEFKS